MEEFLAECKLCPHECKVNRNIGIIGRCRVGKKVKINIAQLHFYEEPCISGKKGSGTIFFSGCNMSCKYCQNYKISQLLYGKEIEIEDLANEFLKLQEMNANNINLVTAVMFVPQIIEAIKIARKKGFKLPIVYNSSGYERIETLKMLEGYVDVYLPDFKYYYNDLAYNLSGINNYFENVTKAIKEMYRQVGAPKFDSKGIIKKGLIIRHLVLPNHIRNSKMVLKWIKNNISSDVYVSIMAQYFPTYKSMETEDINRKLSENEYNDIKEYLNFLNIKNGYIQELEDCEEEYVPNFIDNN